MPNVTASKMHACERAMSMRYKASKMRGFEIRASERCMLVRDVCL
jgi:hypothetical protein